MCSTNLGFSGVGKTLLLSHVWYQIRVPGISRQKSIRTYVVFRPWTHTSDDSYIYQLSLVVATATTGILYLYIYVHMSPPLSSSAFLSYSPFLVYAYKCVRKWLSVTCKRSWSTPRAAYWKVVLRENMKHEVRLSSTSLSTLTSFFLVLHSFQGGSLNHSENISWVSSHLLHVLTN